MLDTDVVPDRSIPEPRQFTVSGPTQHCPANDAQNNCPWSPTVRIMVHADGKSLNHLTKVGSTQFTGSCWVVFGAPFAGCMPLNQRARSTCREAGPDPRGASRPMPPRRSIPRRGREVWGLTCGPHFISCPSAVGEPFPTDEDPV